MPKHFVTSRIVSTALALSLGLTLNACTHSGAIADAKAEVDGTSVKTAPSATTPRLFDCAGENQTSQGNTRRDCLPNQGDAAQRDTQAGAGAAGTEIIP